jgi:hypothetical protein
MLGDFLHNLRASLDYLIWQLVIANHKIAPAKQQFPIGEDEPWFDSKVDSWLAGVHKGAIGIIRGLQPFDPSFEREPKLHPLWLLNELENSDKHRLVHVVSLSPYGRFPFL